MIVEGAFLDESTAVDTSDLGIGGHTVDCLFNESNQLAV
jgi:hypothetical protein